MILDAQLSIGDIIDWNDFLFIPKTLLIRVENYMQNIFINSGSPIYLAWVDWSIERVRYFKDYNSSRIRGLYPNSDPKSGNGPIITASSRRY